jgi:Fe-S-cluster containining protein
MSNSTETNSNESSSGFVCLCCGTCCTRYQPRVSLEEVNSIALNLKITAGDFIKKYTDHRWPGTQSFLIRQVNSTCSFLKPSADGKLMLCSIHSFKPSCCLEWQAGANRLECQEGLNKRWNSRSQD